MSSEDIRQAREALEKAQTALQQAIKAEQERLYTQPIPTEMAPVPKTVECSVKFCHEPAATEKVWNDKTKADEYRYARPRKSSEPLCEEHLDQERNPYRDRQGTCPYCHHPYNNGSDHNWCGLNC